MGSQNVSHAIHICMAGRLCGVWSKRLSKAGCFGLHRRPGGAPSKSFVQGGIHFLSKEARNRIRRKISLGMNAVMSQHFLLSPLPGLGLFCRLDPRLTPWANVLRHSVA